MKTVTISAIICAAICLGGALRAQTAPQASSPLAQSLLDAPDAASAERVLVANPGAVTLVLFEEVRSTAQAKLDQRKHADSLRLFQTALAVAQKLNDPAKIAAAYRGVGLSHLRADRLASALENYTAGLEQARLAASKPAEAELLRGIAMVRRAQGDIESAIEFDQRSIALYRELGDVRYTALGLNNLAVDYDRVGDLRMQKRSLEEAMALGKDIPEVVDFITTNLAQVALKQGNKAVARGYLERALQKAEEQRDSRSIALTCANLGPLYLAEGQPAKAEAIYSRGLALAQQADDIRVQSAILINRAALYTKSNRYALAIADLRESLRIIEKGQSLLNVCYSLANLAHLENAEGQTEQALAHAERAVAIGRQFNSPELLWQSLHAVAQCELSRKRPAEARRAFEQSVEQVESWRMKLGAPDDAGRSFLGDKVVSYHGLIGVLESGRDFEGAFRVAEQAKARQLLDVVRNGKAELNALMTPGEKAEERRLKTIAEDLNAKLARGATPVNEPKLRADWESAVVALDRFKAGLYAKYPGLASRRGDSVPIDLAQLQELLPDRKTVLIEYTVSLQTVYIFAIVLGPDGKAQLTTHSFPWEHGDLVRQVAAFQGQLAGRDLAYRQAAAKLYTRLLGPVAPLLRDKDMVVIVPDGPLWELSFQALVRPDGRHLLEKQAIFYAPSLTFLRENRRRKAESRGNPGVLALGDPEAAHLPRAAAEAREVARLYGAPGSLALTGKSATKEAWQRQAPNYRVLHIATHGVLNRANPLYSYLELSGKPGDPQSALEAREILNMNLRSDLAVLSACETAKGKVEDGEGLVGMSWAFLLAGAPTTVVSQWKVDSAGTSNLMVNFHKALQSGQAPPASRAVALQRSAVRLMNQPGFGHPFYWAGFVMVGDGF